MIHKNTTASNSGFSMTKNMYEHEGTKLDIMALDYNWLNAGSPCTSNQSYTFKIKRNIIIPIEILNRFQHEVLAPHNYGISLIWSRKMRTRNSRSQASSSYNLNTNGILDKYQPWTSKSATFSNNYTTDMYLVPSLLSSIYLWNTHMLLQLQLYNR